MKQLTLFDIDTQKKEDTQMTWLELYNYLHNRANDIYNPDPKLWSAEVIIHDAETGEEYNCDTYYIDDELTLMINVDKA